TPSALEVVMGVSAASIRRAATPRRARKSAAASPVGPAPTMRGRPCCAGVMASDGAEGHVDVAARGVGVGADLMRLLDQVVDRRLIKAVIGHLKRDIEVEAFASGVLAEADAGGDLGVRADGRSGLAGDQTQ